MESIAWNGPPPLFPSLSPNLTLLGRGTIEFAIVRPSIRLFTQITLTIILRLPHRNDAKKVF